MNFRRIAASLSLDAGSYVRELELKVADLVQDVKLKGSVIAGLHAHLDELLALGKAQERAFSELRTLAGELGTKLTNRTAQLEITSRELQDSRQSNDALSKQVSNLIEYREQVKDSLLEAREELASTTERFVQRITALETENDALREQLEMAPRATQLDLVPSPDVPESKAEVVWSGVVEKVYQLAHVCFVDGHKWWFRDGGSEAFCAPILDEDFNRAVARREIFFASGDLIRVRLNQVSTRKGDSYKTVSEVTKVLGILPPAPEQTTLLTEAPAAS